MKLYLKSFHFLLFGSESVENYNYMKHFNTNLMESKMILRNEWSWLIKMGWDVSALQACRCRLFYSSISEWFLLLTVQPEVTTVITVMTGSMHKSQNNGGNQFSLVFGALNGSPTKQRPVINLIHTGDLPFNLHAQHSCMLIKSGLKTVERLNLRWLYGCGSSLESHCPCVSIILLVTVLRLCPPLIWEISVE